MSRDYYANKHTEEHISQDEGEERQNGASWNKIINEGKNERTGWLYVLHRGQIMKIQNVQQQKT